MGYLIEAPKEQQIVTAKITLTSANLLTPGYIVDIPEYPAVKDYYWQVISMNGYIVNGFINYLGSSTIHIQCSTAAAPQFRFGGAFMQSNVNTWGFANIITTTTIVNQQQFSDNGGLQIHNPGTLTVGDSDLDLYITAILLPL
jgi:hypothetical protein